MVVLVQDTTVLDDGTTPPKAGMGTVQGKSARSLYGIRRWPCPPSVSTSACEGPSGGSVQSRRWHRHANASQSRRRRVIGGEQGIGVHGRSSRPGRTPWWGTWPIGKAISTRGWWTPCAVLLGPAPHCSSGPSAIVVLSKARSRVPDGQKGVRRSLWAASLLSWPAHPRGHRVRSWSP